MSERDAAFRRRLVNAVEDVTDPRTVWRRLGQAHIPNQVCSSVDASQNVRLNRLDNLLTELDARLPLGVVLGVCVQVAMAIPLLEKVSPHSRLARQVHSETTQGDAVVAVAATDAGLSGSALVDSTTGLRDTESGMCLNGGKDWVTNASHADYILVLARRRPGRNFTNFGWVLLPRDQAGVSCQPVAETIFSGAGLGHLRFDEVATDQRQIVGRPGRALAEFVHQLRIERLAGAFWGRSLCHRVLAGTHEHLRRRRTGAATLWDNAAIRERFARCVVDLRLLDALCDVYSGSRSGVEDMVLKAACGDTVDKIVTECTSLRGADAFRDGGLASLREQTAMFGVAGGAAGAMLAGIADHVDDVLGTRG